MRGDRARDGAVNRRRDDAELGHQLGKLIGPQRLGAVAERAVGIVVHLDEQAVGARCHGGARHGKDFVAPTGAVGRVGDDGQVRELLHHWDGRNVERVARIALERADAALAQDDIGIAGGQDVLRG